MRKQIKESLMRIHMKSESSHHSRLVLDSKKQLHYFQKRKLAVNPKPISQKFHRSSFTSNKIKACSKHLEVDIKYRWLLNSHPQMKLQSKPITRQSAGPLSTIQTQSSKTSRSFSSAQTLQSAMKRSPPMATVSVHWVKGPRSHSHASSLGSFAVPESAISICRSMCSVCIRISRRGVTERAASSSICTTGRTAVAASRSPSGRNRTHPRSVIDSGSPARTSTARITTAMRWGQRRRRLGDSQLQEETRHPEIHCSDRRRWRVRWGGSNDFFLSRGYITWLDLTSFDLVDPENERLPYVNAANYFSFFILFFQAFSV